MADMDPLDSLDFPELPTLSMKSRSKLPEGDSSSGSRLVPTWHLGNRDEPGGAEQTQPTIRDGQEEKRATSRPPASLDFTNGAPNYIIERIIGRGGMGEVYSAIQTCLGRSVAVKKAIPTSTSADAWEFQREARVAAALEHPNILPVHDLGVDTDGRPLLAMKLIKGQPWDKIIEKERKDRAYSEFLSRQLKVLVDVCQAVAFANDSGFVHRDIKPSQVMVGEFGEVLLTDWGLAVYVGDDEARLTPKELTDLSFHTRASASSPSGTPALMAPEQTQSDASGIGPWTDVFLLGGTLYFLLTGTYPYEGANVHGVFKSAVEGNVEAPSDRSPDVVIPSGLEQVCLKALSKDPRERYNTAVEFLTAIEEFMTGAAAKKESSALFLSAERLFSEMEDYSEKASYSRFDEVDSLLQKSLSLWPENRESQELRIVNLKKWAALEIENGDLMWGKVHVDQLSRLGPAADPDVAKLQISLQHAVGKKRRNKQLLVAAAVAVFSLMIVSGVFAWRSQVERLGKESALAQSQEQARLKDLLSELNELRSDEEQLASDIQSVIPLPKGISASLIDDRGISDLEVAEELLIKRRELAQIRERIEAELPEGLATGTEPFYLLIGEANYVYHTTTLPAGAQEALGLYLAAHEKQPEQPEPVVGMALAKWRIGEQLKAKEDLERAVALSRALYGEDDSRTAEIMIATGELMWELDLAEDDAIRYFAQSMDVLEPTWIREGEVLSNVYFTVADYEKATSISGTASRLGRDRIETNPDLAIQVMLSDAVNRSNAADFEDGEERFEELIELCSEYYGADSENTATVWTSLGHHQYDIGDFDEAEKSLMKAVQIFQDSDSVEHQSYLGALGALGAVYYQLSDYESARAMTSEAIALGIRVGGEKSHRLSAYYNSMAEIDRVEGRDEEFLKNIEKAISLTTDALGYESSTNATYMNNLAEYHRSKGQYEEAGRLFEESIAINRKLLGPRHPQVGISMNNLALVHSAGENYELAEETYRECLVIFEEAFGKDHYVIGATTYNLAEAIDLGGGGREEEAMALYKEAKQMAAETLPEGNAIRVQIEENSDAALARLLSEPSESEPERNR